MKKIIKYFAFVLAAISFIALCGVAGFYSNTPVSVYSPSNVESSNVLPAQIPVKSQPSAQVVKPTPSATVKPIKPTPTPYVFIPPTESTFKPEPAPTVAPLSDYSDYLNGGHDNIRCTTPYNGGQTWNPPTTTCNTYHLP
jgi:hypothetical protein